MKALIILLFSCTAAWAQFLPPEEFDHPFDGRVVIQDARDSDEVRRLCNSSFVIVPLGCSYHIPSIRICGIVKISDDDIRKAGHDPNIFMRHEIGHCNGWPATHTGAR